MVYRFVRNAFLAAFFVPKLLFLLKESAKQRGPIVHGLGDVYFLEVHPQYLICNVQVRSGVTFSYSKFLSPFLYTASFPQKTDSQI